eukprot:scpid60280/ scgid30123/ 
MKQRCHENHFKVTGTVHKYNVRAQLYATDVEQIFQVRPCPDLGSGAKMELPVGACTHGQRYVQYTHGVSTTTGNIRVDLVTHVIKAVHELREVRSKLLQK